MAVLLSPQDREDRLMRAIAASHRPITLNNEKYELYKWNYDQILRYSALLIDVVKDLAKSADPKVIMQFLQTSTSKLFDKYKEEILEVMADTLSSGNFSDPDKPAPAESIAYAKKLIRVLAPEEQFSFFNEMLKDNLLPLAARLDLGKRAPALNQLLQAMKALISSTS